MYRTVVVVDGGLEEVLQVAGFPEVFGRFRRYLQVVREVFEKVSELTTKPPGLQLSGVLWELGLAKLGFRNQVEPRSLRFGRGFAAGPVNRGMIPPVLGQSSSRC